MPVAELQVRLPQPKRSDTKQARVLSLLEKPAGATIDARCGRRDGSNMRGFLSGVVRKKLRMKLLSAKDDSGSRVYRVVYRVPALAATAQDGREPNTKPRKAA